MPYGSPPVLISGATYATATSPGGMVLRRILNLLDSVKIEARLNGESRLTEYPTSLKIVLNLFAFTPPIHRFVPCKPRQMQNDVVEWRPHREQAYKGPFSMTDHRHSFMSNGKACSHFLRIGSSTWHILICCGMRRMTPRETPAACERRAQANFTSPCLSASRRGPDIVSWMDMELLARISSERIAC